MFRKLLWIQIRKINTAELPKFIDREYVPPPYQGASYEVLKAAYKSTVSPTLKQFYKEPLLICEGRKQWLWDHTGRRYLDMFGGIATVSIGHCHPRIADAVAKQASKLDHISSVYMHPYFPEYVEKLIAKLPEKLNVVYLTNSGSEANELAYLLARSYTRKNNIISLRNGYHGGTSASSASTGLSTWKFSANQSVGYIHATNPDVYKGPWGGSQCRDSPVQPPGKKCECANGECVASQKYFEQFKDIFRYSLPTGKHVAAFIAESIQGIGGVVQYPKTFLKKVCDFVHQNGGLYIADEVQTGFGRTGEHFWGFEGYGLLPDIVTMAKGIGNGFPLGAVVTTSEIAGCLHQALYFNTFSANPLACVIGSTVLDVIEEEGLQQNSYTVGTYLLGRLSTLISDFPDIVGDVRGKGLMIGIELISDPKSKSPIKAEHLVELFESIKDMGVLVGKGGLHSNVLRIKPPMCITKEDADMTFEVIREALRKHQEKCL